MRLGILGPLLVADGTGAQITVAAPRQRTLLAALLSRPNRVVPVGELAEIVWNGEPPHGAARTLRSYVMRLRRSVGPEVAARIRTRDPGYIIDVSDDELDILILAEKQRIARRAIARREWTQCVDAASEAIALWRGDPLCDVPVPVLQQQFGQPLREQHLQIVEMGFTARLELGEHEAVAGELTELVVRHPLREHLVELAMLALYRAGRQADAFELFRATRTLLVDELAVEPGEALQTLHQRMLAADPALALSMSYAPAPSAAQSSAGAEDQRPEPAVAAVPVPVPVPVPRQLPAPVRQFVGRTAEIEHLTRRLEEVGANRASAVVISAVEGMAGVGKTALAVQWAHHVAPQFPDGQLYVNLRGYDPERPMPAAEALAGFLRSLGSAELEIPAQPEERAAAYRSLLAGRRILVVLDNAADAEHVRPLLPGSPSCMAVITSRDALPGLVARDGAVRVKLDLLPPDEAISLLRGLIGDRVAADPRAAEALAAQCCQLPLALRVAAELAAARPWLPLADLVRELAGAQRRLDALGAGGDVRTEVRAVFSWSLRHLEPEVARAFRLAALHPGADVDAHALGALAGCTLDEARRLLDRLARAHLIESAGPDRYAMHDLLRSYARELAASEHTAAERDAALTALLDHYLYAAAIGMSRLSPGEAKWLPSVPKPPDFALEVADKLEALAWFDLERPNLLAVAAYAAERGWGDYTVRMSAILFRYLSSRTYFSGAAELHAAAARAAAEAGDPAGEAHALINLGSTEAQWELGREARSHLQRALTLCREESDRYGELRAIGMLGMLENSECRYDQARRRFLQVVEISREVGADTQEIRALAYLGQIDLHQGRYEQSADYFRLVARLSRLSGESSYLGSALNGLGDIALRQGRYREARTCLEQSRTAYEAAGYRAGAADAQDCLGVVEQREGDLRAAAELHHQALEVFRASGRRRIQAQPLCHLGRVALRQRRFAQAEALLHEAMLLAESSSQQLTEADISIAFGDVLLVTDRTDQARVRYVKALTVARRLGARHEQADALRGLASTHRALGDAEQAESCRQQALKLYIRLGAPEADEMRAEEAAAV